MQCSSLEEGYWEIYTRVWHVHERDPLRRHTRFAILLEYMCKNSLPLFISTTEQAYGDLLMNRIWLAMYRAAGASKAPYIIVNWIQILDPQLSRFVLSLGFNVPRTIFSSEEQKDLIGRASKFRNDSCIKISTNWINSLAIGWYATAEARRYCKIYHGFRWLIRF